VKNWEPHVKDSLAWTWKIYHVYEVFSHPLISFWFFGGFWVFFHATRSL
jgi:hypothetical protein